MLGTTGMPLRTKTSSIRFAMARLSAYISDVVRGRLRSLSCLTNCPVHRSAQTNEVKLGIPRTIASPYATRDG